MKIGIVTLIGEFNYGNLLQSYALQTVLERMGHDVAILNRRPNRSLSLLFLRVLSFLKSIYSRYFFNNKDILIVNPFSENYIVRNRVNCSGLKDFAIKYLNRTSPLRSSNEMMRYDQKEMFDAYVVGSDQVWREQYTLLIEEMFLSFLSDDSKAKRIAYAASFGTDDSFISSDKLSTCRDLLNRFNYVSVREKSAVKICKDVFDVESVHVLDPTMLLDVVDYNKIFESTSTPNSSGTLLTYILDDDARIKAKIALVAREKNLVPFSVNALENVKSISYTYRLPSVETWLRGFHDAKFVITDSFHACVFSILFHKPFICIGNKSRGMSRFDSLLNMFGLENRLVDINDIADYEEKEIDWEHVDKVLAQKRKEAFHFLNQALQS